MSKPTDYLNALPSGHRLDEHEVRGVLGAGGFGITYKGFDHHLGKTVAIKEYLPNDLAVRQNRIGVVPKSGSDEPDFAWGLERFLEEARVLARFDHPNIIRVHRYFQAHGTGYIVMDLAEGETLSHLLKRKRALSPDELKHLLFPLLDGLEEMHRLNFLHRDIKPGNIVIREDGSPVILDFGAARQAIKAKSRSVTAIVTPGYAPIEQYSAKGNQGPWTDIYALAAVSYHAVVGQRPEDATNRVYDDKMNGWSRRVKGWNPQFLVAIDKALAFKIEDRPQTIGEWRKLLSAAEEPVSQRKHRVRPSVPSTPIMTRVAAFRRQGTAMLAAAAIGAIKGVAARAIEMSRTGWAVVGASLVAVLVVSYFLAFSIGSPDRVRGTASDPPWSTVLPEEVGESGQQPDAGRVQELLEAGNHNLLANRLMSATGDSAVRSFETVLKMDPENDAAKAGLLAVEQRYVELIRVAIDGDSPDTGRRLLDELGKLNPAHADAQKLADGIEGAEHRLRELAELQRLLDAGKTNLAKDQLDAPGGNNAIANFQRVLVLDPGNAEATAGLAAVQGRLVQLTERAIAGDSTDEARRLLSSLEAINSEHPEAPRLGEVIDDVQNRLSIQAEVQRMIAAGNGNLARNQLMLPKENNAVHNFRRALELDPDNSDAKTGLSTVKGRYVELIQRAIEERELDRGRRLLRSLLELDPSDADAGRLGKDIAAAQHVAVADTAATRQEQEGEGSSDSRPAAQEGRDDDDRLWLAVKDSCRQGDLERYRTAYPNGHHIEAFWRKLSECLKKRAASPE